MKYWISQLQTGVAFFTLSLEKANDGISSGITSDFIAMDIRQAMYELGIITGDISTDDLLGNIFSKFCIGK